MIDNIDFALLCYNEGITIRLLVNEIFEVVKKYNIKMFNIIIVDDGSDGFTKSILDELRISFPEFIRVVTHDKNLGYGAAHRTALLSCKRDWILYTDGDGQYPISNIGLFFLNYEEKFKFYTGIRKNRTGIVRKIITFFYNRIIAILFNVPIYDFGCAFRLINKEYIIEDLLPSFHTAFSSAEQLIKAHKKGILIKQIHISHRDRVLGKSHTFNVRNIFKMIIDMVKYKWFL